MFNVHPMGLGKTIKAHRIARGMTLEKLEELSGVAVGTIHALESRDSSRSQYFPALARAMGLTVEDLDSARPPDLHTMASEQGISWRTAAHRRAASMVQESGAAYGAPILAWDHPDDLPDGDFVMIPRLHVSADGGQVQIELVKEDPQAFRTEWIRQQRLKPAKLAAMTAAGESMHPTIHDGDSLLVDTSQTDVVDGKVYALWYDGGERVKRLFRLPGGGLRIKSDNPEHGAIDLGADYSATVRIIGRVVHRSGVGGL